MLRNISILSLALLFSCAKNEPPSCSIIAPANDEEIVIGANYMVTVEADDPDGNLVEITFYLNDEKVDTDREAPFLYEWWTQQYTPGTYAIKAIATDDKEASATATAIVNLIEEKQEPLAGFYVSDNFIQAGDEVSFIDTSKNDPTDWTWDFGDGSSVIEQNPSHTYTDAGVYSVSLTISNDQGTSSVSKERLIVVKESLAPIETGTIVDARDGATYNTILINGTWWMAENLAYLENVSPPTTTSFTEPHSYVYGYLGSDPEAAKASENYSIYGVMYNWNAAKDACPEGWYIPTAEDWNNLFVYLGLNEDVDIEAVTNFGHFEGGRLKESGFSHWDVPNAGATNSVGFSALPGGFMTTAEGAEEFWGLGQYGKFYSSSENAYYPGVTSFYVSYNTSSVNASPVANRNVAHIRCVK
jgi:uncharacterized protein (TIGR02145 family)